MKPESEKRLAAKLGFRIKEANDIVFIEEPIDDGWAGVGMPKLFTEPVLALWRLCGELMEKISGHRCPTWCSVCECRAGECDCQIPVCEQFAASLAHPPEKEE